MFGFLKKLRGPGVDYKQLIADGAVVVDVRTPAEFRGGHAPKALNIPLNQLSEITSQVNKEQTVLVCCASGMRSAQAASVLKNQGYQVFNAGPWTRLIAIALLVFLGLGQTACAQSNPTTDQAPEVFEKTLRTKGQLVDVRTPAEFATGHLEGAINIDIYSPDFEKRLAALDKNVPLYLYCRSGGRSGQALAKAKSLGFKKAVHMAGGITAWQGAGKKTVK